VAKDDLDRFAEDYNAVNGVHRNDEGDSTHYHIRFR
jgi:hypothetical protein